VVEIQLNCSYAESTYFARAAWETVDKQFPLNTAAFCKVADGFLRTVAMNLPLSGDRGLAGGGWSVICNRFMIVVNLSRKCVKIT